MKTIQRILLVLAFSLMGFSAGLHAEDIDIYVDNATNDGVPNVLFVFDNGANFDAAVTGSGCAAYSGTTEAPSMGTNKAAGILQCALVEAIQSLPDTGAVNIGIMASNANGFASDVRSASDPGYHEVCSSAIGGCLLRKLTLMNAANKASLVAFVKSWKLNGANTAANFSIKVNTATPATTMQEAWAYYSGKVGMSGKDYATSLLETGCQKNFLVYVANTDKNPANESNPSPQAALAAPQVGATADQLLPITGKITWGPPGNPVCGALSSVIADNWADEWTRLMFQKNGGAAGAGGKQNITTYTIGMDFPGCLAPTAALLNSMADVGGGKYFSTSNASAVAAAFAAVLNEVQAVNSVFSSASLPVSVNAEGTYLNQIYLGMFRPDVGAAPRWLGNLKQYQLVRNTAGSLVMGDAAGNAAISSAGTGFISPNAVSFWTKKDVAVAPDAPDTSTPPKAGFFRNDPKGVPPTGYDSPDGEVVEKGGVAQQLRLASLTASFSATTVDSNNPRRLYTYCPLGSGCNPSLTHNSNQFSTGNALIPLTAFGLTVNSNTLISWLRGADNFGGELGPGGGITVRPSIHGDVLHSRPLVVNYGDSRGIVAFYGSNDGIFHAINGNQTAAISGVPAGGEMWGLVLPEHYGALNRQRINSPELKFPSSTDPSFRSKDYFVDGPTGAYQKLKADGTIDKAYIFMTMRRGGRFMYALDVSDPTAPVVLWKISNATAGFSELGQTWSRPRVAVLQRDAAATTPTPVLIFGAGYDAAEDAEPPTADTMGRGVYVINAITGDLIWSATPTCTTSATCVRVAGLTHAVPADIAFVDRDSNGYTDKLYFGDTGGNVWRADVNTSSTADWSVTKVAALGCDAGACASGTTPRKFFFPPSVLTVKPSGQTGSYDLLSIASGDREHPLKNTSTGSSYNVVDRFFMVKDQGTTLGSATTSNVVSTTLFNATSTLYDNTLNGFYITLARGEKAVNAPIAVLGSIYFATNRPIDRASTCVANLGEAKAYAVNPFFGSQTSNILPGGGLAPSAVTGLITVGTTNADGTPGPPTVEKFCIGCGVTPVGSAPCNSALENCKPATPIPKNLRRSYWYKK